VDWAQASSITAVVAAVVVIVGWILRQQLQIIKQQIELSEQRTEKQIMHLRSEIRDVMRQEVDKLHTTVDLMDRRVTKLESDMGGAVNSIQRLNDRLPLSPLRAHDPRGD
jgi:ubiquinone biosynthesis protein UbiJ